MKLRWLIAILLVTYVSSLELQNSKGYFLQISDIHLDTNYSVFGDVANNCHYNSSVTSTDEISPWGHYDCDTTWPFAEHALSTLPELFPDPDFILWTGDSGPHVSPTEMTMDKMYEVITNVSILIHQVYPNVTIIPALGNHDTYPDDQTPMAPDSYYETILRQCGWQVFLTEDSQQESFLAGGYFAIEVSDRLTVLTLNTMLWYQYDTLIDDSDDPDGQFAWLRTQLQQARDTNKNVYLSGHIAMGTTHGVWPTNEATYHDYTPKHNHEIKQIMQQYNDVIVAAIFGHEHAEDYRMIVDDLGDPLVPIYIASSITTSEHASSVRTYDYNRENAALLDMTTYYMTIPDTAETIPQWKMQNNFTTLYEVDDMSAESLGIILNEFDMDDSLRFDSYFLYLRYKGPDVQCNFTCQIRFYCAATQVEFDKFEACIDELIIVEDDLQPGRFTVKFMLVVFYSMLVLFVLVSVILAYLFYCKTKRPNKMYSPLPNYIQM